MALEGGDAAGVDLLAVPIIDGAAGLDPVALDPGQHHLVAGLDLGDRVPASSTVPVPSWPRQCGTHLSSPLSPRHSITWVPQAPE